MSAPSDGPRQSARGADPRKRARGAAAHRLGIAAEAAVAQRYEAMGAEILNRRLRTPHGEIDLIAREASGALVFVEVKASRTIARAAEALTERQWRRLEAAALCYISQAREVDVDMRFDVALATRAGDVRIIRNARSFDDW